ncbi:MAG: endo-1,4-beta-xylanase [Cyclobacteriaceae bacterium]
MTARIIIALLLLNIIRLPAQDTAIPLEAENAEVIGADFEVITEDGVTYVTPSTDLASSTTPGSADKVLSFEITFDAPGTYALYTKVRVGPNGADDDSFYFASGFGEKTPDADEDWIRVNNIGNGAAAAGDYVLSPSENLVGNGIFKWINASQTGEGDAGGTFFVVEDGNLTQTYQIGSRENGLDIDKIAFGNADLFYTVANLENGEAGVVEIEDPDTPDPIALGQDKFLGSAYSPAAANFNWYWNQITPENAGKWGSVESTRDQMNWTVMDQTYNLGKENDMYVKFHVLIWGAQQPGWIENLPPAEQLEEIREWFTAVAERYPDLDAIEVVNEPLHQPPDASHEGNYIEALGGSGETGWDWIITSFELAREIFPESVKLMINDYGIIADGNAHSDIRKLWIYSMKGA